MASVLIRDHTVLPVIDKLMCLFTKVCIISTQHIPVRVMFQRKTGSTADIRDVASTRTTASTTASAIS